MNLLHDFFRHNTMMNERLLDACRGLTPDQLEASVDGTYGGIGATLVHIANAQAGYAARLLDVERPERLAEDPFPGFDPISDRLDLTNQQLEQAASTPDVDRQVVVTGDEPPESWTMPVALFLIQAVNHSTEHRSQVATILTQLGIKPPEMSGWTYFEDSGQMTPDS